MPSRSALWLAEMLRPVSNRMFNLVGFYQNAQPPLPQKVTQTGGILTKGGDLKLYFYSPTEWFRLLYVIF